MSGGEEDGDEDPSAPGLGPREAVLLRPGHRHQHPHLHTQLQPHPVSLHLHREPAACQGPTCQRQRDAGQTHLANEIFLWNLGGIISFIVYCSANVGAEGLLGLNVNSFKSFLLFSYKKNLNKKVRISFL